MSKIYLIRHGQASFGKSNYDQLSELGSQQAKWLGDHLNQVGHARSIVLEGNLVRHKQTSDGIETHFKGIDSRIESKCWNEFDFETLLKLYLTQHPNEMPSNPSPKVFFGLLRKAIHAWSEQEIQDERIETWLEFSSRVNEGIEHAVSLSKDANVLVVTSGGAIAMVIKQLLGLEVDGMIDINMQTKNTSITELYSGSSKTHLVSYNATPHLEHPDRISAITSL